MRILLVEDHELVRHGLRRLLEAEPWVTGVEESETAAQALERLRAASFDLVMLDLSLPDATGLEVLSEIGAAVPVLVLSMHVEESVVLEALRAGARGYLVKSASAEEMVFAAKAVIAGGTYVHGRVAAPVLRELRGRGGGADPAAGIELSPRQEAVLAQVAQGRSNREIAARMHISVSTIKAELQDLFQRLGVSDRTRLVVRALELGLLPRPPRESDDS